MMKLPPILQGESLTRLLQGMAVGAVATLILGFGWGGWTRASTALAMANERADAAVVMAMAPGCAEKFRALADFDERLIALSNATSWRTRRDEFPKELITFPGKTTADTALIEACSELVLAQEQV